MLPPGCPVRDPKEGATETIAPTALGRLTATGPLNP
jgi:hypothetical protein